MNARGAKYENSLTHQSCLEGQYAFLNADAISAPDLAREQSTLTSPFEYFVQVHGLMSSVGHACSACPAVKERTPEKNINERIIVGGGLNGNGGSWKRQRTLGILCSEINAGNLQAGAEEPCSHERRLSCMKEMEAKHKISIFRWQIAYTSCFQTGGAPF